VSVITLKNSAFTAIGSKCFTGYIIGETLGQGSYSQVMEAQAELTGESVAIKIALPQADTTCVAETGCFLSRAVVQMTGSFGDANIEPRHLLMSQYQPWLKVEFEGWPSIRQTFVFDEVSAVVMDKVRGVSLRQLIRSGAANLDHALALVKTLARMEACSPGLSHCDLKPENIMLSHDALTAFLLDPGFFGLVCVNDQPPVNVSMTTPNYYPFLKADDIFAFGVVLLELLSRQHPLARLAVEQNHAAGLSVGETLRTDISRARASYNYFPSGIYGLPMFLSENRECFSPHMLAVALKCMSLEIVDKLRLEIGPSYSSFTELLSDWHT
jgi:serine/threonine protein kinase